MKLKKIPIDLNIYAKITSFDLISNITTSENFRIQKMNVPISLKEKMKRIHHEEFDIFKSNNKLIINEIFKNNQTYVTKNGIENIFKPIKKARNDSRYETYINIINKEIY